MCNLYRLSASASKTASRFGLQAFDQSNAGSHLYPGSTGLVIADGRVRSMVWGFPLSRASKKTGEQLKPKPVNNARTDKLDGFFWRSSFEKRRCLIPLEAFAEAEGPRGKMTRTWMTLPGADVFAVAGIWRDSGEWGPSYSMVMTDASEQMARIHDRMPVVLTDIEAQRLWQSGTPDEARALCRPFDGELTIERTEESWVRR